MNRLRSTTAAIIALVICIAVLLAALIVNGIRIENVRARLEAITTELIEATTVEEVEEVPEDSPPPRRRTYYFQWPILPADFDRFTSPIGERDDPLAESVGGDNVKDHTGLDIATVWRARTRPVAPGIVEIHWPPEGRPVPGRPGVVFSGDPLRGAWIQILHDNGWRSRYLHLAWTNPETVHEGERVEIDDVIGRVGDTGQTTGAHLHLELINPAGEHVNPLVHLEAPNGKDYFPAEGTGEPTATIAPNG